MNERASERVAMVEEQLRARGINDEQVLRAMRMVPRHLFVDSEWSDAAYTDHALPIPNAQTISQPFVVARMAAVLNLRPDARVLEIGTGSGYAAAVLAQLAAAVYTVERHRELALQAITRFEQLGLRNIWVGVGDGTQGWLAHAPYDGISVAAAGPDVPLPLRQQLTVGGRLVMPVGGRDEQHLMLVERTTIGEQVANLGSVRFVPLIGEAGWAS